MIDNEAPPSWVELRAVIPLRCRSKRSRSKWPSAEEITSLSSDTLVRRFPDRIKRLSEGRVGMTLGDALEIAQGKAKSAA
jgi:hypothetical protein